MMPSVHALKFRVRSGLDQSMSRSSRYAAVDHFRKNSAYGHDLALAFPDWTFSVRSWSTHHDRNDLEVEGGHHNWNVGHSGVGVTSSL